MSQFASIDGDEVPVESRVHVGQWLWICVGCGAWSGRLIFPASRPQHEQPMHPLWVAGRRRQEGTMEGHFGNATPPFQPHAKGGVIR